MSQTAALPASNLRSSLIGAAVTSQLAALIMAVVIMVVFTVFLGKGPIYPVQVIGSVAFGEAALQGFQLKAFLAGLVFHQTVGLIWGLVFGVVVSVAGAGSIPRAATLGLAVSIVSMIDAYYIVPAVMIHLHGVDIWNREVPLFWDWAAHMVYGLSFGLYPLVVQKLAQRGWL